MSGKAGFFRQSPVVSVKKTSKKQRVIDVGGEPFHAVAVALMDQIKIVPRSNESALKKILERFYTCFPRYKPDQTYLTPAERMNMLINNPRKSEIVECMAYVLRQLTVDELFAHSLVYRDVFDNLSADTPKRHLREPSTFLPISALAALARVLELTITLSFKETDKELGWQHVLNKDARPIAKWEITLQVQNNRCFPEVTHADDFKYVGQLAINFLVPAEHNGAASSETIATIVEMISSDNKKILHIYEQWQKNLLGMVNAGELTREMLLSFYTSFLPEEQVLPNSVGSREFFSRLEETENKVIDTPVRDSKYLLVRSLAQWISTEQVSKQDKLFDLIENPKLCSRVAALG
jgi:hypothetical protein